MLCPICSGDLVPQEHEGIAIAGCAADHGVWLSSETLGAIVRSRQQDRPELEEELAMSASAVADPASETPRSCPACGTQMRKHTYAYESGVLIDSCPADHGVWLDRGELQRVEAWVEGNERVAASERAAWQARLNVVEKESDNQMADAEASVHARGFRGLAGTIARARLRRDDR